MKSIPSFQGGIHPQCFKAMAEELPIKEMPPAQEIIIPMCQHAGAAAKPLVKKGDKVLKWQKIGDNDAFITAPVHSSVSGDVLDVRPHIHPLGQKILSVFIKPDGLELSCELQASESIDAISPKEIVEKIRQSGVVGLGGAAFPTHVKLSPPKDKKIDTLVINAVECEPYLAADYRVMMEESLKVTLGVKLLLKALGISRCLFAIEDNKPRAIEVMREAFKNEKDVAIVAAKTKYPQGSEKQLIAAALQRRVPMGKLPMDVGVVVQNVGTAKACAEAVLEGKPLIQRVVTVAGSNIKNPANLRVRIGTKFSDIIDFCGGGVEKIQKIIMGGPMMGIAVSSADVPLIKGVSGILLLKDSQMRITQAGPCIRCGKCIEVCPMALVPCNYAESAKAKDFERTVKDCVLNCMECGACGYICPAKIPLVQWIKIAKLEAVKLLKKKEAIHGNKQ